MGLFRNKEIKRLSYILFCICTVIILAGFLVSAAAGAFSAVSCGALCLCFFIFMRRRYRNIAGLCEQIDIVLHGGESLDIEECDEGELAILRSEIHKMTIRLREHADILDKEKNYLSESMADIAHQLRTPLTSMNMIVSFMADKNLDTERRIVLARELESLLLRVDWLITTLLKISKIDAGTAVFRREKVMVSELIQKASEPFTVPLELKNIELEISGDDSSYFIGDLKWSAEAISNIIKNCIEHTDEGGKIVICYSTNALFSEIMISDNGNGINEEDLPHIFERFYQGRNTQEGNYGIGLALCRMILSKQNASVKAENIKTGGVRFIIRFYYHIV